MKYPLKPQTLATLVNLVHLESRLTPRILFMFLRTRRNPPSLKARSWLVTGKLRLAMVKKLTKTVKSAIPQDVLNLTTRTQAGSGSVVGTIVREQMDQLSITVGIVRAITALGVIIGTTLYPMLNLSLSMRKISAQQGVEGEAGVGTGSLGDMVPTFPPGAAAELVRQREVVAKDINSW